MFARRDMIGLSDVFFQIARQIEKKMRAEEYARQANERNIAQAQKAKRPVRPAQNVEKREIFTPTLALTSSRRQAVRITLYSKLRVGRFSTFIFDKFGSDSFYST